MDRNRSACRWSSLRPLLDIVTIVCSFAIAYWVRYDLQWIRQVEPAYLVPFRVYAPSVLMLTGILLLVYWSEGAYRSTRGRLLYDELAIVLRGTMLGIATTIVIIFLLTPSYYSRLIFVYTGVIVILLVGTCRAIERVILGRQIKRGVGVERLLLVGAGEVARSIMRAVVACPELGYQIIGFIDDDPIKSQTDIGRYPAMGTIQSLPRVLRTEQVDIVIITLPWMSHRKIVSIMDQCDRGNIRVRIVPDLFQMSLSRVVMENLNGIPLLGMEEPSLSNWQSLLKRATDVIVSALGLVILAPFLGIITLAIKLDSPGPAVFRQERVGKGGERFTCYKFRSMVQDAESRVKELSDRNEASGPLFKMRDDPRQTKVGRFLRRTSLDELPQLWNVFCGEMSLIGPRPAIPSEVAQYESWHRRRLEVSPGITGLWQVSGRSDLTFDEMVLLDIYYIENWSPFLELRILLKTIPTVLLGWGAY